MEKNQLKWYEAPTVEVVEMEAQNPLLAYSEGEGFGGSTEPSEGF